MSDPNTHPFHIVRSARAQAAWISHRLFIGLVYLVLFVLLDWLARSFQIFPGVVAWYPPDGLSFALLLGLGPEFIPAVVLASLISSLFIYHFAFPTITLLAWAVFSSLVLGGAAFILRRLFHLDMGLRRLRDLLGLIIASAVAAAVLAVVSTLAQAASGAFSASLLRYAMVDWWVGEVAGILALTPMMLVHVMPKVERFLHPQPTFSIAWKQGLPPFTGPTAAKLGLLLITIYLAFVIAPLGEVRSLYLLIIPLTWVALEDGLPGITVIYAAASFGAALSLLAFSRTFSSLADLQFLLLIFGAISFVVGIIITEHKRTQTELQGSEQRYHSALDQMLEGCMILDHDWRCIYVNPAAARQTRREPSELLHRTLMEIYPGVDKTPFFARLTHCLKTQVPERIEQDFSGASGKSRTFEMSIQPVPEGLFLLSIDISDRNQLHLELERSERRFRALIENSSDAITLVDANGTLVYDSPAAPGLLGYGPTEHIGSNAFEFMHPDDKPQQASLFQQLTQTPGMRVNSTFRVRHNDGSWHWVEAVTANLLAEPSVQAIVVNYRDITRRHRAEEQLQRQLNDLHALRDIDKVIVSSFGMSLSLGTVISYGIKELGVDAACVQLFNPVTNTLSYVAGRGFRTLAFERAEPLYLTGSYAGRAALEQRTIHISNLADSDGQPRLASAVADEGFVSYFGVPLITKGRVIGVLEVFHRSPLEPDEDWLWFLDALAGQAAIAIDNATMFEKLERSNSELTMAYDATIEGWSHALDLRDKETEGHAERVTDMTVKIARAYGMTEKDLADVRRGALLHDIGKMGIPDHILLKPGPLTPDEWAIMRQHPQFAYDMLAPIRYLERSLSIPYAHHEKWDGSGYPRGLKGDQIPLEARIFAVVDVWDAITSDRPYRPAWSREKALEHIRSQAGTHFDPEVVRKVLASGLL